MPSLTREEGQALLDRQKSRPGSPQKRRTASTPKEREIQKAILDFLATVPGVVAWKTGGGMFRLSYKGKERVVRMGRRGVSDIVGWRSGRTRRCNCSWVPHAPTCVTNAPAVFLAIEVKRPGAWPTEDQTLFLASVQQAGGIAVIARSVHDVALALGLAERGSGAGARG